GTAPAVLGADDLSGGRAAADPGQRQPVEAETMSSAHTSDPDQPLTPLTEPADGLTGMVDTPQALAETVAAFATGTGPVAVDAERASGYRYGQSAYLVQLRREGAGTALVDPQALPDLSGLSEAIGTAEWVLHAANQDLPCLAEVGMRPAALFDTELGARLLGYQRVGLGTMVAEELGLEDRKSTRLNSSHVSIS